MPRLSRRFGSLGLITTAGLAVGLAVAFADDDHKTPSSSAAASPPRWRQHDVGRPKPPVVEPAPGGTAPTPPPRDAVVLFDGANLDAWTSSTSPGRPAKWRIVDGALVAVPGTGQIETKARFGDIQLHVEWAAPKPPAGKGQNRGNSGVFLMGQFEIQVLDSYQADTYADGQAGAIYGQYPPLANASRPPGEWQTFDIAFRRPRFNDAGALLEPARITVLHNGVLVQNNEEPFGPTSWLKWNPYDSKQGPTGPIALQDHNHPVKYRNIWLRELPERAAPTAKDLARPPIVALSAAALDQFVGDYQLDDKPNGSKLAVKRENDHLTIKFPFRPTALALEPTSDTHFVMPFTDGEFTFHKDDQGRVDGVRFRIGDSTRESKKAAP